MPHLEGLRSRDLEFGMCFQVGVSEKEYLSWNLCINSICRFYRCS